MKYHYEENAVRWFKWHGKGDVRGHRPTHGWEAAADLLDVHPITGKPLPRPQWWIRETYNPSHPSH